MVAHLRKAAESHPVVALTGIRADFFADSLAASLAVAGTRPPQAA